MAFVRGVRENGGCRGGEIGPVKHACVWHLYAGYVCVEDVEGFLSEHARAWHLYAG